MDVTYEKYFEESTATGEPSDGRHLEGRLYGSGSRTMTPIGPLTGGPIPQLKDPVPNPQELLQSTSTDHRPRGGLIKTWRGRPGDTW